MLREPAFPFKLLDGCKMRVDDDDDDVDNDDDDGR